jgi:hypothetical protein
MELQNANCHLDLHLAMKDTGHYAVFTLTKDKGQSTKDEA